MNFSRFCSGRWAWISLAALWLVTRIYPLAQAIPWTYWEVWEAKKLLEYGWLERAGGIVEIHFMTGHLFHPEAFNYVNHPYPILWLLTAIHWMAGEWGILMAVAFLGLGSVLLTFHVLKRQFGEGVAWWTTTLYVLAPSSVFFNADPNIIAQGAVLWPVAAWIILGGGEGMVLSRERAGLLALAVFLAGQISWMTLMLLPSLVMISGPQRGGWKEAFAHPSPFWKALVLGAAATVAIFGAQILFYTPNFHTLLTYARGQSALGVGELSRWKMLPAVGLRALVLVGPALWVGVVAGLVLMRRRISELLVAAGFSLRQLAGWKWRRLKPSATSSDADAHGDRQTKDASSTGRMKPLLPLVAGSAACFFVFAGVGLILTRFFFRERTMYEYLLFPGAVLTAFALQQVRGWWLRWTLISLAVLGCLYSQAQVSIVKVSQASRMIGAFVAQNSRAEDLVLSNLVEQAPPFQSWDVGSREYTATVADRLLRFGVTDLPRLKAVSQPLIGQVAGRVFVLDPSRPVSAELRAWLGREGRRITSAPLSISSDPPSPAMQIRNFYWKLLGQHVAKGWGTGTPATGEVTLEVYRLP